MARLTREAQALLHQRRSQHRTQTLAHLRGATGLPNTSTLPTNAIEASAIRRDADFSEFVTAATPSAQIPPIGATAVFSTGDRIAVRRIDAPAVATQMVDLVVSRNRLHEPGIGKAMRAGAFVGSIALTVDAPGPQPAAVGLDLNTREEQSQFDRGRTIWLEGLEQANHLRRPYMAFVLSTLCRSRPVTHPCTDGRWLGRFESKLDGADSQRLSQPSNRVQSGVGVAARFEIADGRLVQPRGLGEIVLGHLLPLASLADREFPHTGWTIPVWLIYCQRQNTVRPNYLSVFR